ncbi:MAG: hypothetical protein AAFP92_31275, partial [Bacteroidota bacterium]
MKTPLLLAVLILSVTGGNRLLGQELSVPSQNTFSSTDGLWLGGIPLGFRYDAGQTNLALGFQGQYFWEKRGQKDFPRLGFGFRAQYLFGANLNFGSRYFTHGFVLSPEFLVLQPLFDRVYFLGSLKAPYSRSEGQLRMLLPPQDTIRIVGEQSVIALYVGLMLDFRSWFLQISSPPASSASPAPPAHLPRLIIFLIGSPLPITHYRIPNKVTLFE